MLKTNRTICRPETFRNPWPGDRFVSFYEIFKKFAFRKSGDIEERKSEKIFFNLNFSKIVERSGAKTRKIES